MSYVGMELERTRLDTLSSLEGKTVFLFWAGLMFGSHRCVWELINDWNQLAILMFECVWHRSSRFSWVRQGHSKHADGWTDLIIASLLTYLWVVLRLRSRLRPDPKKYPKNSYQKEFSLACRVFPSFFPFLTVGCGICIGSKQCMHGCCYP